MTGFGRGQETTETLEVTVEIRAVNHRYFDFNAKISKDYIFLEDKIKAKINSSVSRGKIDFYLYIDSDKETSYDFEINTALAEGYADAFKSISKKLKIKKVKTYKFTAKYLGTANIKKSKTAKNKVKIKQRYKTQKCH